MADRSLTTPPTPPSQGGERKPFRHSKNRSNPPARGINRAAQSSSSRPAVASVATRRSRAVGTSAAGGAVCCESGRSLTAGAPCRLIRSERSVGDAKGTGPVEHAAPVTVAAARRPNGAIGGDHVVRECDQASNTPSLRTKPAVNDEMKERNRVARRRLSSLHGVYHGWRSDRTSS
jgi:hypothetical protein